MGDKAFVTPSVMKWARETARMTIDIAAEKIGVSAKRLAGWESGMDKPTVTQAKKAANVYKRPFSRTSYLHSYLTLNSDEFQGFAIADPLAPFIFINTEDWAASQLFTLVHELAHLWIAESGVSCEIHSDLQDEVDLDPVERFCNQVAAIALMPKAYMDQLPSEVFGDAQEVFSQAKSLGVSSFAFLIRARQLDLVSANRYQRLKKEAEAAFREFVEKEDKKIKTSEEKRGGPDAHRIRAYRNGLSFSRLVMDAFRGGLIPPTLASRLLGAGINDFEKMEKFAYV
jgi:Zn-dependent peptidase ImmA (M78 family)